MNEPSKFALKQLKFCKKNNLICPACQTPMDFVKKDNGTDAVVIFCDKKCSCFGVNPQETWIDIASYEDSEEQWIHWTSFHYPEEGVEKELRLKGYYNSNTTVTISSMILESVKPADVWHDACLLWNKAKELKHFI